MLFNSLDFALFLPIVFILYWLIGKKSLALQNILLLVSSYFFYACWDFRFLFLLMFSTSLDYVVGIRIHQSENPGLKRFWLLLSISASLALLGFFKYYNFFANSFAASLSYIGITANLWILKVILPLGISFYTFHGLSYVIDVYNSKVKPEKNFINYAVFVSFFPLLVAGPIERATHLLPQIQRKREFNYSKAVDGLRQILWGLFKKMVIADNCAVYVNPVFSDPTHFSGSTLVMAAVLFAFQIYADFSGYSDIALGTSRLLGIEVLRNFAFPYFSRDIAEFWRRWHISLTSWFRDYVYIPLGGNRGGRWHRIRNIFIIFLLSGLWHGANWTFIAWGALNAAYFLPLMLLNKNRDHLNTIAEGKFWPGWKDFLAMAITFGLTTFGWILFRADSLTNAGNYISGIFSRSLFTLPSIPVRKIVLLITIFMIVEWSGREQQYALQGLAGKWSKPVRWSIYYGIIFAIFYFSARQQKFIYFQF